MLEINCGHTAYGAFIIYRPGARGIRQNITLSDDISRGACPEGNIIAEGNILPNIVPPSGGPINDILYRKICHRKNSTTWTLWLNYLIKTACNRKRNVHDQSYSRLKNPIS